ncbi:polymorphic toxin type 50 domain-containing protein [Clostridium neuense]|uniref:Polymorphic toxin type 50 domain-containing protein n=1 Tax=Clostridium neuense TaxID=1728934 RepID=A0ABW8TLY3_9CLOT
MIIIAIGKEKIETTAPHLFYTEEGFKPAEKIKAGEKIKDSVGIYKEVTDISTRHTEAGEAIYNLNVEDYHTYFAGESSLLVHNDCSVSNEEVKTVTDAIKNGKGKAEVTGKEAKDVEPSGVKEGEGDKGAGNADKLEIVIKDGERYIDGKPVKINQGQQDKHIVGTNNYNQAVNAGQQKSILTGDADKLLDEFAGTGTKVSEYKERVDFGQVIGKFYDIKTGLYEETTMGMITYGKNGAHIIPSNPNVY